MAPIWSDDEAACILVTGVTFDITCLLKVMYILINCYLTPDQPASEIVQLKRVASSSVCSLEADDAETDCKLIILFILF